MSWIECSAWLGRPKRTSSTTSAVVTVAFRLPQQSFGARGVGIDIDPKRIEESRANAKAAGVDDLVEFRLQDALKADVSDATVVTLYMLASGNAALRPMLTRQLRPGARIVSHAFSMGPTWPADKVDHFTSARGDEVTLYLWKADGKIRP